MYQGSKTHSAGVQGDLDTGDAVALAAAPRGGRAWARDGFEHGLAVAPSLLVKEKPKGHQFHFFGGPLNQQFLGDCV